MGEYKHLTGDMMLACAGVHGQVQAIGGQVILLLASAGVHGQV